MKPNNGKIIGVLVLATLLLGVATLGSVQVAHLAHADTNLVFKVDATTAAGGVYARFGPHTSNTTRTNGYGVYPNQFVKLLCGVGLHPCGGIWRKVHATSTSPSKMRKRKWCRLR